MATLDLVLEPRRLNALLVEAARWADRITLYLSAPDSEQGGVPAWAQLLEARNKFERVVIHRAAEAEAWLLHRLHETGTLRLADGAEQRFATQLLGFRRDQDVRLFLAHVPLTRAALESDCGGIIQFSGHVESDFALSAQRLCEAWLERSRGLTGSELDALGLTTQRPGALPSLALASPITIISDPREVTQQIAVLVRALQANADRTGSTGSPPELPMEGQSLTFDAADGVVLTLAGLSTGFRLEIDDSQGREHPTALTFELRRLRDLLGTQERGPTRPDAAEFASPLSELALPVRAANWADRKGLHALRDLIAWHPDAFGTEPNVGRVTVAETRVVVERALGREWEEVWAELGEPKTHPPGSSVGEVDASSGPLPAPEQSLWNRRWAELSAAHLALPLLRLDLPARMRGYCEQQRLTSVGELLAVPRDELLAQPNLGRASLVQTLEALDRTIEELDEPAPDEGLMSGWRRLVQRLPALKRMILLRRSGASGPRETLESLGETLGLTRERVRQIEARCLDDMRNRSAFVGALQRRLGEAFAGGRCVPLTLLLESDPWWLGIDQHLQWTDYVFERLLDDSVHRLQLEQQGRATTFFARFTATELRETEVWLLAQAARIPTPCGITAYEPLLDEATQRLDPALREALQALLEEQLCFDEADSERVLGFGNTKPDQVIALLANQPHPIPVGTVFEALGRCRLPEEVLYFRRGLVGLEQHFPDFQRWSEQLVPACLALMAELPAGRQWMVIDLHEALRGSGAVPDWLSHWHLASLLRRSGRVDYLGRLRVALPSDGQRQQRIHLEDAVLTVLREADGPLAFESIARGVRARTDIRDGTLSLMLISSPFVELAEDAYGLVERDVPGGPDAIARAVETVVEVLEREQRGLTTYQAFRLAQAEVAPLVWSQQLVTSLLRSEPQLRLSRSGQVGLASWDDVRAPTRGEFIRQQVEKAGGRLDRVTLEAALIDTYGGVPAGAELDADCRRHELRLGPRAVVARESMAESPATTPARDVDLSGRVKAIPAAARQHFDELLCAPAEIASELLERARAHLGAIEDAGRHNEFIDVPLARRLVELLERLLEHAAGSPATTQRIARAAVLYFISTDDADDDFELAGLDDDKAVLDAVLTHLELDWA